jgi:hypothetical protein
LRGRRSCLSFLELRACHAPPVVILSAAKDLLLPLAVRFSYRRHLAGSFDSRGDFPGLSRRRRTNKIRNHHRYFRLSISVLDKLMTTPILCAGGKVPGGRRGLPLAHPPQIATRFSHRSNQLHPRLCNISRPHDLRNFCRQLVALVYPERSERAAFVL